MARPRDIDRKVKVRNLEGKDEEVTVGEACVLARKLGAPLRDCAAFAGISAATLHNWTARGREHRPDYEEGQTLEDCPQGERVYVEFLEQMEVADGQAVVVNLALLRQRADAGDTKAITWLLERLRRREFGPRIAADLSGRIDVGAEKERAAKMSDDELDEKLAGVGDGEESP
jgi:hypothetical protein